MNNNSSSRMTLSVNALAIAFSAALAEQVFHEAMHGVTALIVGVRWEWINLFAVSTSWNDSMGIWSGIAISGTPALLNILTGFLCVQGLHMNYVKSSPAFRLFVFYLGTYSLFSGFGYIFIDPLFYHAGEPLGDWKHVVGLLGGGWEIRLPLILIGAAGILWTYVWMSRSVFQFVVHASDKKERVVQCFALFIVPYVGVNFLFTILSFWHPLGIAGVLIAVFKYWFGFIGFFWSFFISSFWLRSIPNVPDPTPLPQTPATSWLAGAVIGLLVAALVLLPTVHFS